MAPLLVCFCAYFSAKGNIEEETGKQTQMTEHDLRTLTLLLKDPVYHNVQLMWKRTGEEETHRNFSELEGRSCMVKQELHNFIAV